MKVFVPAVLSCVYFNIIWQGYASSGQYAHISEYDGKTCSTSETVFTSTTPSQTACSALCQQNGSCAGVFHKTDTGSCVGCSRAAFDDDGTLSGDSRTTCLYRCDKSSQWEKVGNSLATGRKRYRLFEDGKDFFGGRITCRRLCADLVHLVSFFEQFVLSQWVAWDSSVTFYMTGLVDYTGHGDWRWVDDDTHPGYQYWATGEPDVPLGNGKCVHVKINGNKWVDEPVLNKCAFLCEKK